MRLRPDLAETHNNYAAMLERKGDVYGALEQFRIAAQTAPDISVYQQNFIVILFKLGKYDEARVLYEGLLKQQPDNPVYLCNYGCTLFQLGRNDEAIAAFQQALKIAPNLRNAQTSLQEALQKRAQIAPPVPIPSASLLDAASIKLF